MGRRQAMLFRKKQAAVDEQIAEIEKLNAVIALSLVLSQHHVNTKQTYTSYCQQLRPLTKLCNLVL